MQNIRSVIYEDSNAIFTFEIADVIGHLKPYVEQNVREAGEILKPIFANSSSTIKVTSDYFGCIVLDLIKAGKGHAYCKTCKVTYDSAHLTSVPLGFGKSPFAVNVKSEGGFFKRVFGKRRSICGTGGVGYECPKGHELISVTTWTGILKLLK